jgi:hypothetical protein
MKEEREREREGRKREPVNTGFVGIWGSKNKNFLPHKPGLLEL